MTVEHFDLGKESSDSGAFVRQDSRFRDAVSADASSDFPAAAGRYHLYVAKACPWAHRTLIVRALKGLEGAIDVSYAHPYRDERGWAFPGGDHVDQLNGFAFLSEAYERSDPSFDGRVSVPVLWDKVNGTIVNNESAEIIRMFNSEFDAFAEHPDVDLYPEYLRPEIDRINDRVYDEINNGVYKAGFSGTQEAYEDAFDALFAALAWLEELLGERRYLAGDVLTEADWRLFTTLARFDAIYYVHFRCNGRLIADHPNLWGYARELYALPGIAETFDLAEAKEHYYTTHDELNPKHIVPKGPFLDWTAPHGRDQAFG